MATKEKEDKQIVTFQKEATPLLDKARTLEIKDPDDMIVATELLTDLNKKLDAIKKEKDKVLKPLKAAADAEKARWKPMESLFEPLVDRLRDIMGKYQTEQVRKQKAEEAKIAERIGEGKGKIKAETAVRKFGEIERADTKVQVDGGSVGFRTDRILKITNKELIPLKYYVIDEKAILEDLKSNVKVPGAEIEEIQVPVNRRR